MTKQLSPAAQAVLDAYEKSNDCYREEWGQLAAALCAAADQGEILFDEYDDPIQAITVENLLAIAKELEAH